MLLKYGRVPVILRTPPPTLAVAPALDAILPSASIRESGFHISTL